MKIDIFKVFLCRSWFVWGGTTSRISIFIAGFTEKYLVPKFIVTFEMNSVATPITFGFHFFACGPLNFLLKDVFILFLNGMKKTQSKQAGLINTSLSISSYFPSHMTGVVRDS